MSIQYNSGDLIAEYDVNVFRTSSGCTDREDVVQVCGVMARLASDPVERHRNLEKLDIIDTKDYDGYPSLNSLPIQTLQDAVKVKHDLFMFSYQSNGIGLAYIPDIRKTFKYSCTPNAIVAVGKRDGSSNARAFVIACATINRGDEISVFNECNEDECTCEGTSWDEYHLSKAAASETFSMKAHVSQLNRDDMECIDHNNDAFVYNERKAFNLPIDGLVQITRKVIMDRIVESFANSEYEFQIKISQGLHEVHFNREEDDMYTVQFMRLGGKKCLGKDDMKVIDEGLSSCIEIAVGTLVHNAGSALPEVLLKGYEKGMPFTYAMIQCRKWDDINGVLQRILTRYFNAAEHILVLYRSSKDGDISENTFQRVNLVQG
jgi:hypothetical protein